MFIFPYISITPETFNNTNKLYRNRLYMYRKEKTLYTHPRQESDWYIEEKIHYLTFCGVWIRFIRYRFIADRNVRQSTKMCWYCNNVYYSINWQYLHYTHDLKTKGLYNNIWVINKLVFLKSIIQYRYYIIYYFHRHFILKKILLVITSILIFHKKKKNNRK